MQRVFSTFTAYAPPVARKGFEGTKKIWIRFNPRVPSINEKYPETRSAKTKLARDARQMASCETATGDQSIVAELFWQRAKSKNSDNYAMGEARHTRRANGEGERSGRRNERGGNKSWM